MRKRSHLNQSFNAAGVEDGVSPGDSDTGKIASDGVVPPPIPARPVLEQQQQQRPGLDHRVSHHRSGSLRAAVAANTSSLPAPPPAVDSPAAATLIKERTHWQTMLASVLTGEVIRSEKRRITGTVTQKQQLDQKYQIWLGIRAYLRGRSVPEERQRIDERRVDAENSINELMHFEVQTLPPPNSAAATSTTGNGGSQSSSSSGSDKSPYDQVVEILAKIDKVESLYPTRKALVLDKPIYAGLPFQHKHEALSSWLTISNSLRLQLQVLKNWTGSEDLLTSRTQHPLSPDKRIDTSFIERILKESGVKRTFLEIRIMSVLRGLLAKCKASMIENASAFKKMQLPTYINELQQLASFPSNLMEEILKYQLEYTEKQAKLKGVMLDHIEEFAVSLSLAIRIKHECQELDQQAQGWSITNSLSPSYDMMLLKSLRYYFTLLNWRLRSSTDTVFFKEAEMLENEWNFMSTICFYIDGGDVETAVQFCELEAELLGKVHTYLDNSLRGVVGDGIADSAGGFSNVPLTGSGLVRWYARMLDNVRSREKKLLKFQKTLTKEFENSSEYTIADPYPVLLKSLLQTGHALVRTDAYANQGVYIFASSSLSTRPEAVAKLLRASFAKYDNFHEAIGEGYVLILSPKDRLRTAGMNWQGRSMQVRLGKGTRPIQLKNERIRLVADTSERLEVCKAIFEGSITCKTTCVKARRAHIEPIHEALKKVKKRLVKLAEGVLSSVQTVRSNLSRMTAGGGSPGLMMNGNLFDFASDFGCRALKYVGAGHKHGLMMKRLVGLAVDWVDFCASDCQVGGSPPVIQQKAFKWSLLALQFAMTATSGGQVYSLTDADFCELRMGVARCMRVLIRGFEQGGGSNGSGSGSQVEEMLTQALKGASSTTTGSRYTSTSDTSLQRRQKLWLAKIEKLEEERMQRQQANRIVGKVLDTRNVVERNISFLASTSSSISLRWQQGKFLGGGSFGSVYMAINLETADLMAVKEIRFKDVTSIEALQRSIKDEMNVLQLLHHPNIIEYYGVEVHRDKLYIFMEYCPHSVASLLEHGGRFGDEMVVKVYAKQMLKGLEYLHGKGIVHRDVKPANTLLGQEGDIKFVDFGASKIYKSQKTVVVNGETNTLVGTPHYIAPEVITSEPLGRHGAQDIWSMGCCVLEMITGRKPWSGLDNEWAVMYHIGMSNRIPPLPEASTCSEAGIDFLRQCFTRPAAERPTAKELLQHDWV
ncbi:hypothetical protein DFS34DRAFT_584707, partial [Phlyctochytrium arcticum]